MRITKVKVNVDNTKYSVDMKRDNNDGFLHADKDYKKNSIEALLQKKSKDFQKSILNKTLVKKMPKRYLTNNNSVKNDKPTHDKSLEKSEQENLKNLNMLLGFVLNDNDSFEIKKLDGLKKLKKDKLYEYLGYKFQNNKQLDLSELLYNTFQQSKTHQDIKPALQPYKEWANEFIERKQKFLAKSIENNSIGYSATASPRKKVLDSWKSKLVGGNLEKHIENLSKDYNIEDICNKFQAEFESFKKNSAPDNNEFYKFKQNLKKIIHDRQKELRDNKIADDIKQYGLEVSKYLELYFPLKKSGKNTAENKNNYYIKRNLCLQTLKLTIANKIKNATLQSLIQGGKLIKYDIETTATSEKLMDVKIQEAFALQFIDVCCFAANNLRNAIDKSQSNDILGKKEIRQSLEKAIKQSLRDAEDCFDSIKNRLSKFYFEINKENDDKFVDIVSAIRSSIQSIRNNIVHFKKDAFMQIINVTEYESLKINGKMIEENGNTLYSKNVFLTELFKDEIGNINLSFAEKLKSGRLFEFYDVANLEAIFKKEIELHSRPLAFIPSFKNVFKLGGTYEKDRKAFELESYRLKKSDKTEVTDNEEKNAYRYALQQIYEIYFIKDFLADRKIFADTVADIIVKNKKENNNKFACAYAEVERYSEQKNSPIDYLRNIQSKLIQEESKKREAYNEKGKIELQADKTGNFQNFLWTLFLVGFDKYLKKNTAFDFIKKPKYNAGLKLNEITRNFSKILNIKHKIDSTQDNQIAFWTLCKMLDNRHLNELNNQISKMQQAISDSSLITTLHLMQEIIQLSLLNVDTFKDDKPCFEDIKDYLSFIPNEEPYVQNDKKTYVLFAHVKFAEKYATKSIITKVLENDKVSESDIDRWRASKKDIETMQMNRAALHQEWAESQNKRYWVDNKQTMYAKLCEDINKFNWLDNKVHLTHVKYLHNILIEILGRLAGFVALFDRDFQFLDYSSSQYRQKDNHRLTEFINFGKLMDKHCTKELIKVYNCKLKQNYTEFPIDTNEKADFDKELKEKRAFFSCNFFNSRNNPYTDRSYIAHFNYFTKGADKSILQLLIEVRELVSYDRKLKNAVLKSFIDILDRHNITIKLKLNHIDNTLTIASIEPKMVKHLGQSLTIKSDDSYCKLVEKLLKYKK